MFKKIKHIHFVGIGGSGMSGIAEVLIKLGYRVTGSDVAKSAVSLRLENLGANVYEGHVAANVAGADVVVTSTAIAKKNPEVMAAHKAGIPVIPRIEMLAEIARLKYTIAVSGTHGKTTTTSLIGQIFQTAGLDPTVIVGGRLRAVGTGGVLGSGDYLVAEADESDGSFLKLSPTLSIVTNIDNDHLDYYKTMDRLEEAFITFADHVPFYGMTYLCGEDPVVRKILPKLKRRFAVYGFNRKFELSADKIVFDHAGSIFEVYLKGKHLGSVRLPLSGKHNVLNALAAVAVSLHADIPFNKIADGLGAFPGVGRRIEEKGEANGVLVVDDYGHHPTEIKATLAAVRSRWPERRLVVMFQPHRYSRTQILHKQFSFVLKKADKVLLLPIYPAGERPLHGVTSELIARALKKNRCSFFPEGIQIDQLQRELKTGDLLLTLGAGDVWKWGEKFIQEASSLAHQLKNDFPSLISRIKSDEPLSRHCTWALGGPAEVFVELHDVRELQGVKIWCNEKKVPMFLLGWGSNILLPDEGLRGVVIRLRGNFESIEIHGETVRVGAGVHLPKLAKVCVDHGLAGVESLAGVPGTVGGALMTNAGTPRGVIGDVISSVDVMVDNASIVTIPRNQIDMQYRQTNLVGKWIVAASLNLKSSKNGSARDRLKWELDFRQKTQPLGTKNVGSVFRNPPGDHAARLIEAAGLKGKKLGGLQVSPKHANFIENNGKGTAKEALALIELIQKTVREKFNIQLHPEVIIVKQSHRGSRPE